MGIRRYFSSAELGGVPGGWAEAWALPGRLQVEHSVLTLVGAGGCHPGDQGGQAAQLRVAVSTAGPAAQLRPLGAEVRHHGLGTCAQCVKLRQEAEVFVQNGAVGAMEELQEAARQEVERIGRGQLREELLLLRLVVQDFSLRVAEGRLRLIATCYICLPMSPVP